MFGSEVLEVGIGLVLIFLFLSLICTAAREGVEMYLRMRAADLERGIRELLDDPNGTGRAREFFAHPLIDSLFKGEYQPDKLVDKGKAVGKYMAQDARGMLPSYIPSAHFAAAFVDLVTRGPLQPPPAGAAAGAKPTTFAPASAPAAGAATTQPLSFKTLMDAADKVQDPYIRRILLTAIDGANNDVERAKAHLETWFNGSMERVSGWYKRRTQQYLFLIGLVAAVGLNVDAVMVARQLLQDKPLREAVVSQAKTIAGAAEKAGQDLAALQQKSFAQLTAQMSTIGFPVGWPAPQLRGCASDMPVIRTDAAGRKSAETPKAAKPAEPTPNAKAANAAETATDCAKLGIGLTLAQMAVGWLITALAVMLGAPFWFDVLSRLMVIRSTVKTDEARPKPAAPSSPSTPSAAAAKAGAASP